MYIHTYVCIYINILYTYMLPPLLFPKTLPSSPKPPARRALAAEVLAPEARSGASDNRRPAGPEVLWQGDCKAGRQIVR